MNKNIERPACKECGGKGFYKLDGEVLCENCVHERIEHILDNYFIDDKARMLGIGLVELDEEELG